MAVADEPLTPYTELEIADLEIKSRGIRNGEHVRESRQVGNNIRSEWWSCAWDKREDAIRYFLGDVVVWNNSGTLQLSRLLPQRHPEKPELAAVQLTEMVGYKFLDLDGSGNPTFERAELHIQYEHCPFKLKEDDEVSSELDRYVWYQPGEATADAITFPGGILRYIREDGVSAGNPAPHLVPIPFNISKVFPVQRFKLRWVRLPEDVLKPTSTALSDRLFGGDPEGVPWIGCINKEVFYGYPNGTLLLEKVYPLLERSPLAAGWQYTIEFEFAFKPGGWNWLPFYPTGTIDKSTLGLYFVGKDEDHYFADALPDDYSLYNSRDFNLLFSVNP